MYSTSSPALFSHLTAEQQANLETPPPRGLSQRSPTDGGGLNCAATESSFRSDWSASFDSIREDSVSAAARIWPITPGLGRSGTPSKPSFSPAASAAVGGRRGSSLNCLAEGCVSSPSKPAVVPVTSSTVAAALAIGNELRVSGRMSCADGSPCAYGASHADAAGLLQHSPFNSARVRIDPLALPPRRAITPKGVDSPAWRMAEISAAEAHAARFAEERAKVRWIPSPPHARGSSSAGSAPR